MMILDSKNIQYEVIDITEPGRESDKEFMQNKATSHGSTVSDPDPRHALPPQIFNSENYCGDYHAFDLANEIDTLEQFLKLAMEDTTSVSNAQLEINQKENGTISLDDELDQNKENEAIEQLAARNGENNNENEEEHEDKNENDVHEVWIWTDFISQQTKQYTHTYMHTYTHYRSNNLYLKLTQCETIATITTSNQIFILFWTTALQKHPCVIIFTAHYHNYSIRVEEKVKDMTKKQDQNT